MTYIYDSLFINNHFKKENICCRFYPLCPQIQTTDLRFLPTQQASLTVDISAMRTTSRAFIGIQATKVMNP